MNLKHLVYKSYKRTSRFLRNLFKPYHKTQNPYWVQKIEVTEVANRWDYFEKICQHKKVLHFGCTDWPVFNPENNLHIQMAEIAKELHGFDIDEEGIERLRNFVDQPYYSDFSQIPNMEFDVCLIPETIEHVDNVAHFIEQVSRVNAAMFVITAPNSFNKNKKRYQYSGKGTFIEMVHPDHNYWFSPYTLKNCIEKYSDLKVEQVMLLNKHSMVCCVCRKP